MKPQSRGGSAEDVLSTLALEIVQAASRPDCTITELARLAEQDPAFAARLLHVVNSPVNGISRRVSDVKQATSLLGVNALQNIALALAVTDLVPLGPSGEALLSLGLRRACAARRTAELMGYGAQGEAFTTGLMLELGVLKHARTNLEVAAKLATRPALSRPTSERVEGFEPHPASGAFLARKWHLPEHVIQAIAHHHEDKPLPHPLPRIAWVAERIAAVFEGGEVAGLEKSAVRALQSIGVAPAAASTVLKDLPAMVREAGAAFQRKVGAQVEVEKVLSEASIRLIELNRNFQDLLAQTEALLASKEKLVADLERANEELKRLASTDALTGLYNRRAFMEALRRDLARAARAGTSVSAILFDVDHFKKVNDTHGHQVGDAVLVGVARATAEAVRTGDVVGRYGGEEFVVLLAAADLEGARIVAERIREQVRAATYAGSNGGFQVTASFGVATWIRGEDADQMLKRADAALYRAKDAGRNNVMLG